MFKDLIRETPFTGNLANSFFANITGDDFDDDVSFVASLRALLCKRLPEGESVSLKFYKQGSSSPDERTLANGVLRNFLNGYPKGSLTIQYTPPVTDLGELTITKIRNVMPSIEGWVEVEKVSAFFRGIADIRCYINPKEKKTYVYVVGMTAKILHVLQCGITAMLPWYFDMKSGLSELELELIKSLRERSSTNYLACLAKLEQTYDFRAEITKKLLADFEMSGDRERLAEYKASVERLIQQINNYNERIGALLRDMENYEVLQMGIEEKIASHETDSSLAEYFETNKNIICEDISGGNLRFTCTGYLELYDPDMVERMLANKRSVVYREWGYGQLDEEEIERLMTAIFVNQEIKIRVCATYEFQRGMNVRGVMRSQSCAVGRMPNPHIYYHACLGNYNMAINELLTRHDYIGALEQCAASARSLNFGDSTVMSEFLKDLRQNRYKCLELPDGRVVGTGEAITWLSEIKEGTNE